MIRLAHDSDIEKILKIWLSASLKAHNFIAETFWKSKIEEMRNLYLPSSEVYVFEKEDVLGFYALYGNVLAAIFVDPIVQNNGIGSEMLLHALKQRNKLTLHVYKENSSALRFYRRHGFICIDEQIDSNTGQPELILQIS